MFNGRHMTQLKTADIKIVIDLGSVPFVPMSKTFELV
jgi:hypothetical protein